MVHLIKLCCHVNQMQSLYSLTHSMIESVRSACDWWMLFSRSNNPLGAMLNNDQHNWLMSAVSSCWVESFSLSLLPGVVCDERSPFAGMMMIDTIRSQLFHWSLHTSWSLTSGISKMNGLALSRIREVIFCCAHVKASWGEGKERKNMTQRKHSLIVIAENGRDHFSCLHKLSSC